MNKWYQPWSFNTTRPPIMPATNAAPASNLKKNANTRKYKRRDDNHGPNDSEEYLYGQQLLIHRILIESGSLVEALSKLSETTFKRKR